MFFIQLSPSRKAASGCLWLCFLNKSLFVQLLQSLNHFVPLNYFQILNLWLLSLLIQVQVQMNFFTLKHGNKRVCCH